uniref:Geranylgeranyl transferase type-2 subunit alpha n=1 Tax=Aquila chrysaetos chrysaetos TaxID=223781 RepID=A0A663EXM8_AQUCH
SSAPRTPPAAGSGRRSSASTAPPWPPCWRRSTPDPRPLPPAGAGRAGRGGAGADGRRPGGQPRRGDLLEPAALRPAARPRRLGAGGAGLRGGVPGGEPQVLRSLAPPGLGAAPGPRAPPPTPAERALCDRLLAADPRNFHAWEHRRTLAAEEDPEAELAFAGTLLSRDFSNFSAWHHRSRLLAPTRTPASPGGGAGALPPHRLQTELELVQNAVFTDPNDQSAWVYLRCILSRASPPPRILCLYVNREDATLAVTFSRPVVVGAGSSALTATVDGSALEGAWRSGEGRPRPSHTWVCDLPPDLAPPPTRPRLHFRVTWEPDPAPREVTLLPDENEAWWQEPIKAGELFWPEVGVAEASVLEAQVETCRQLLELEPRSRGCLLTLVLLLSALDPLGHEDEIRRCLRDLQEADPLRIGFVGDVASRAEAAVGVLRMGAGPDGAVRLRLHRKALTSLPLLEHTVLVTHLDLAGNNLGGLPPTLGGAAAPAGAGRVTQQGHDPAGVPAPPPPGGAASRRQPHKPRLRPGPIGHVPPAGSSAIG